MGEEIARRGLTIKSLFIGSLIVVAVCAINASHNCFPTWYRESLAYSSDMLPIMGLTALVLFLISLINSANKIFSRQEIVVITLMILAGTFVVWNNPAENLGRASSVRGSIFFTHWAESTAYSIYLDEKRCGHLIPWIWGPKDVEVAAKILFTRNMDLELWGPSLWYFLLTWICIALNMIFLSLLLRHLYVDIENMSFPLTEMHIPLINLTQSEDKIPMIFTKYAAKWFWIPFALEFMRNLPHIYLVALPTPVYILPPTFIGPPFHGYPLVLDWDYTPLAILPWIPLRVILYPGYVAFGYILPLDVLVGYWVGSLLFNLLPVALFVALGLLPPFTSGYGSWPAWRAMFGITSAGNAVANWGASVALGGVLACALYPLWIHRSIVKRIFKAIITQDPDLDSKSPIKHKWAWIGFLITALCLLASMTISEVPLILAIPFLIAAYFVIVGATRIIGEAGGYQGSSPLGGAAAKNVWALSLIGGWLAYLYFGSLRVESREMTAVYHWMIRDHETVILHGWMILWCAIMLLGFSLARKTNTRIKDVFIAILMATILGVITTTIMGFLWVNMLNFTTGYTGPGWGILGDPTYVRDNALSTRYLGQLNEYGLTVNQMPSVAAFIYGFAGLMLIYILRARFPALLISPAGVALAMTVTVSDHCVQAWVPLALALILKYLTLRILGHKWYEEKGRLIAAGIFAAWGLTLVIRIWLATLHNAFGYGAPYRW